MNHVYQFCVGAAKGVLSPFVLQEIIMEALQRLNPAHIHAHLRTPAFHQLVQRCQQAYLQVQPHKSLRFSLGTNHADIILITSLIGWNAEINPYPDDADDPPGATCIFPLTEAVKITLEYMRSSVTADILYWMPCSHLKFVFIFVRLSLKFQVENLSRVLEHSSGAEAGLWRHCCPRWI